jgi:hypothetical protein
LILPRAEFKKPPSFVTDDNRLSQFQRHQSRATIVRSRYSPSTKDFRHTLRHDGVDYGNYLEQLEPQDLAGDAVTELEAVIDDLKEIVELIEREEGMEK